MIYIICSIFFYKNLKSVEMKRWKKTYPDLKILFNLSFLSQEYFWRFLDSLPELKIQWIWNSVFFITHVLTVVWTDSKCWDVRLSECRSDNSLLYSRMNSLKEDSTFGLDGGGVMKSYSQDGEKSFSRLRRKYRR